MSDYKRTSDSLIELLISEVQEMRAELKAHKEKEEAKLEEMVQAFKTAKGVVFFVKWLAALAGSCALAWAWLSDHFTLGVK